MQRTGPYLVIEILVSLLAGNYGQAALDASDVGYVLYEYSDTELGMTFYILENNAANYWGTYVYNPSYCRSLIIQSPHPKKDFNTGKEGIHVFRQTEAIFFQLSGTHRCNQIPSNTCSGTTKVCSDNNISENYKISDMAHSVISIFQATTGRLAAHFSTATFVSLHGFTKKSTDPYVIMSNGTRQTPNPDYISILDDNLLIEDNVLTFEIAHINLAWTRLIGFTNTQGRLINSSPDPCHTSAVNTAGRFIHLEQEKSRLRQGISGWNKMANALSATFSCTPLAVDILDPFSVILVDKTKVKCAWATSFETQNDYFEVQRSSSMINWQVLSKIDGSAHSNQTRRYQFIDKNPLSGISFYRLKQVDKDGAIHYSAIRKLTLQKNAIRIYPNPASGLFNIEGIDIKKDCFKVFNALHQKIRVPIPKTGSFFTLNLSDFPNGWYLLVSNKGTFKLFKEE